MSKLSLKLKKGGEQKLEQEIGQKQRGSTSTSYSGGPSLRREDYPLLERALLDTAGVPMVARFAVNEGATTSAGIASSISSSTGVKAQSTSKIQKATSKGKLKQTLLSTSGSPYQRTSEQMKNYMQSKKPTSDFFGDVTPSRGEKITVDTLADYLEEQEIYDAEEFMEHATQQGPNRGRQIYKRLASKDWDKKLGQAIDIARSYTPNTSFRARVENYQVPQGFDYWRGTCTYNEYMALFQHHGIGMDKIARWFKTLFGDNGKKNTIYMWGKADAGKTTIIKLFDAFYDKWEIGRCSAQNINSNFWLQDLYQKRLFHADEIVATQVNIDTLKLLLEGSDDLTTDIKYAKKVPIRGRPVMMATNDPIWINMSTAADPIRKRCEYVHMTRPWTKPAPYMSTRDKNILQYVQNRLFNECFPRGYDEWLTGNRFQSQIDEITDEDLVALAAREAFDIDDFVSEMN